MAHPLLAALEEDDLQNAQQALAEMAASPAVDPNSGARIRALLRFLSKISEKPQFSDLQLPALDILVRSLALCDQQILTSAHPFLLEQLVPGLLWRDKIPQYSAALWKLYQLDTKGSLYAILKVGLKSDISEVRTASVQELGKWTVAVGGRIAFHDLTPTLVQLLNDPSKETRAAVYSLLVLFFSKSRAEVQNHLFATMAAQEISDVIVQKIKTAIDREITGEHSKPFGVPLVAEQSVKRPASHEPPNSTDEAKRTTKPVTENAASLTDDTSQKALEIMGDPMYAFKPLEEKYKMSDEEYLTQISGFVKTFEGKETENNWSQRLKYTKDYRTMLRSHYTVLKPKTIHDGFSMLRRGFSEAVLSMRTILVTEICYAIKDTIQVYGSRSGFHELFDTVMDPLAKVATGPKKITSAPAHLAICVMLIESTSVSSRQFGIIVAESRSIKTYARPLAYYWLRVISVPNRISTMYPYQSEVENIVIRAINDASPAGRTQGRELFKILEAFWPAAAAKILPKLNSSSLKLLKPRQSGQPRAPSAPPLQPPSLQKRPQQIPRSPLRVAQSPQMPESPKLHQSPRIQFVPRRLPSPLNLSSSAIIPSRPNSAPSLNTSLPLPDLNFPRAQSLLTSPRVDEVPPPRITSSPLRRPTGDLSRSIGDLSIRDQIMDLNDADEEQKLGPADDSILAALDESDNVMASAMTKTQSRIPESETVDLENLDSVRSLCETDAPQVIRSIAVSELPADKIKSLIRVIFAHSNFKDKEAVIKFVQQAFQESTSFSEGDGYMEILKHVKDYTPSLPPTEDEVGGASHSLSQEIDSSQFTRGNTDYSMDKSQSMDDSIRSESPKISVSDISSDNELNTKPVLRKSMNTPPTDGSPRLTASTSTCSLHSAPRVRRVSSISVDSSGSRSSSSSTTNDSLVSISDDEVAPPKSGLFNGLPLHDSSKLIPLLPTAHEECLNVIREMILRVNHSTASPQDLASLAVIIKASTITVDNQHALAAPVSVWRSRFTFDMEIREFILPYLSSDSKNEDQIVTGLLLLRVLLTTITSYSKPYLDTFLCLRHLHVVANKYQRRNMAISNLLMEIYELIASRELESSVGIMNALLSQPNVTFSLQLATKLVLKHAEFANEAEKGLRVLVSKTTRDPDVRVRQHLYPMLVAIHSQNRQVFDAVVTPMSQGQRRFVDYYLEVETVVS